MRPIGYIATAITVSSVVLTSVADAEGVTIHDEVMEWVIEPCVQVAAAVGVKDMERESVDLGIKREHLAKIMAASREQSAQAIVDLMKDDTTWEERRAVYPTMLKMFLSQIEGL